MAADSLSFFTDWLDRTLNFERTPAKGIFWLDTMRFFTERLGHPERSYRCLHVAGSKGKGSMSMMAACVLQEAGYKVGVYTSPHITDFRERICTPGSALPTRQESSAASCSGVFFPDRVYEEAARKLMALVDSVTETELPGSRRPTWFELVTLFAMLCFKAAGVDWAVWEVGLGGRLDSTNVVQPDCCLIGPIEKEHTEFLGDTLEKIAGEKAGIIKRGVPVIVAGQQSESVRNVFRSKAAESGSPILFSDEQVTAKVGGYLYSAETEAAAGGVSQAGMEVCLASPLFSRPVRTTLRLLGRFQAENAACVVLALKTLFPQLAGDVLERGLARACLPGRFEIVAPVAGYEGIPALVLDGAHTVRSVALTMESFDRLFGGDGWGPGDRPGRVRGGRAKPVLLFACAADKDVEDISNLFTGHFSAVFLTRPGAAKAADLARLSAAFTAAGLDFQLDGNCRTAIAASLQEAARCQVPLLVTGSFYLVAAVKDVLAVTGRQPSSSWPL